MKFKKFLCGTIFSLLFVTAAKVDVKAYEMIDIMLSYDGFDHKYHAPSITMIVNGNTLSNLDMPPVIIDDYTLVPAREVFEQTGALVDWDGGTGEVQIRYENDTISLHINNILAEVNGEQVHMSVPPKIINNKTMIPVRFTAESLGFDVDWNKDTWVVTINSLGSATADPNPETNTPPPETDGPVTVPTTPSPGSNTTGLARDISPAEIPEMAYPQTAITAINIPGLNDGSVFTIAASSEISKVSKFLLEDNRLVIDIYGAEMKVPSSEYTPNSPMVSQIRVAQNQMEPEMITRVVLELKTSADYGVSISPDRKNIYVTFERVTVSDVSFSSDGTNDYIRITGNHVPATDIYSLTNPDRLIIDMPNVSLQSPTSFDANGRFVSSIQAAQTDSAKSSVTINMKETAIHSVTTEGNTAIIKLSEPTYRNIKYDSQTATMTLHKNGQNIAASQITHTDLYSTGRYVLTLPGDFSGTYGYGEYPIKDQNINSVEINSSSGSTVFVFHQKAIKVVQVTEDNENLYLKLESPKSLYKNIVIIDPGHGGTDPGTSGNGLIEKDLTSDISRRVMDLLDQNLAATGIKAYATRTEDTYISRFDRAPIANPVGDLFVSIHINSASPNQGPNGTETYYYPHGNDGSIGISTKQTADIFHKHLISKLGLADRKVKENNYTVLVDTTIPSVLCEIGFISNPEEAAKLGSPEFRQQTAQAIYEAIVEVFTVYNPQR